MQFFIWMRSFAVPVFMMMSFIFTGPLLEEHNAKKIKKRIERLFVPQIGWAVIYWCIYKIIDMLYGLDLENGITDLFWQIFFGHSQNLNVTMWYQVDLIYITILFLSVILIFKRSYIPVLYFIGAVALVLQYSGINMFFNNSRFEVKYSSGRFMEMLPVAVIGFMIARDGTLEKTRRHKYLAVSISIFTIFMVNRYNVFIDIQGYGYSGIKCIAVAAAFIILFYFLPLNRLSGRYKKVLIKITSYTMGIYCMHQLVYRLINLIISVYSLDIRTGTFSGCIFIYIICFICAYLGHMFLGQTKLKSLFN